MSRSQLLSELNGESHESMRRRHEFTLRKMSFCTGLLGLGAIFVKIGPNESLMATPLLFAVPLVATLTSRIIHTQPSVPVHPYKDNLLKTLYPED